MDVLKRLQTLIHEENGFRLVAGSMNQLLAVTEDENSSSKELVSAILKQVSLTERLLHLANTVGMRSTFTQSISTVQGAVLLLGTDQVRRIAVMLTAYEGISNMAGNSKAWLQEFQVALVASELARKMSSRPGFGTDEECATVTLLRGVSRILTACACPGEWLRCIEIAQNQVVPLEIVSRQELGLSYSSISQSAATAWGLPDHMYQQISPVSRPVEKLGAGYSTWVQVVSACAYDVAETVLFDEPTKTARLQQVLRNFAGVPPAAVPALAKMLEDAVEEVKQTFHALGAIAPVFGTSLASDLRAAHPAERVKVPSSKMGLAIASTLGEIAVAATQGRTKRAIFHIAVEGLARSLGASRAALVLRDPLRGAYESAAAYGMPSSLASSMSFPDRFTPDLISAVVATGKDFVATDVSKVKTKLPEWYVKKFGDDRQFALFPLSVKGEPIGFLYADWTKGHFTETAAGVHDVVSALKSQLCLVLKLG